MKFVLTIVWYPWTASVRGAARTSDEFVTLDREVDLDRFHRLPATGETIFFDDGGSAKIEASGWKLDGRAYLFLGKRYEKDGEAQEVWTKRGFAKRPDEGKGGG